MSAGKLTSITYTSCTYAGCIFYGTNTVIVIDKYPVGVYHWHDSKIPGWGIRNVTNVQNGGIR